MSVDETQIAEAIVAAGRSLHNRGLSHGSSGNISVRLQGSFLMTPTGCSLGDLDAARLSRIDHDGRHVGGDAPTKEAPLHLAMYRQRAKAGAIVHLHATCSSAVSCLAEINCENVLPPLTAYYVMRIGRLPLIPFHAPGAPELAGAVEAAAGNAHAMLLANHGPIIAGADLADALANIEELEQTARIHLLTADKVVRPLSANQIADLVLRFGPAGERC